MEALVSQSQAAAAAPVAAASDHSAEMIAELEQLLIQSRTQMEELRRVCLNVIFAYLFLMHSSLVRVWLALLLCLVRWYILAVHTCEHASVLFFRL